MIGNPRRKHHKRRHHRRHLARNPVLNPRRHRRHHRRHSRGMIGRLLGNPGGMVGTITSPVKELASVDTLMDAGIAAVGFVVPNMVVTRLPAAFRDSTVKAYASKVGAVVAVSAVGGLVSKKAGKLLLLGGAVGLVLDLYTDFVAPHLMGAVHAAPQAAPANRPALSHWFGNSSRLGAWYGDNQGAFGMGDGMGGSDSLADAFAS